MSLGVCVACQQTIQTPKPASMFTRAHSFCPKPSFRLHCHPTKKLSKQIDVHQHQGRIILSANKQTVLHVSQVVFGHLPLRNFSTRKEELVDAIFPDEAEPQIAIGEPRSRDYEGIKQWIQDAKQKYGDTYMHLHNPQNNSNIVLVGTAHISEYSAKQVKDTIQQLRPDYVVLEMDQERLQRLVKEDIEISTKPTPEEVRRGWLSNMLILRSAYFFMKVVGFLPSKEFAVAYHEAKKVGAKVALGDMPMRTTLRKFSMWSLLKEAYKNKDNFEDDDPLDVEESNPYNPRTLLTRETLTLSIENSKRRDVVRKQNTFLEKTLPQAKKALMDDREEYYANILKTECKGVVVGVVGLAHLDGIEAYFNGTRKQAEEKTT